MYTVFVVRGCTGVVMGCTGVVRKMCIGRSMLMVVSVFIRI